MRRTLTNGWHRPNIETVGWPHRISRYYSTLWSPVQSLV